MYVVVRDPLTTNDIWTDSLSGFVSEQPVDQPSPGVPLSEVQSEQRQSGTLKRFKLKVGQTDTL